MLSPETKNASELIAELRDGLDERIARELPALTTGPLSETMSEYELPLTHFIDYLVFEDCENPIQVHPIVQDADSEALDGVAILLSDWSTAQRQPVPAMTVFVDWSDYDGTAGAKQLAEQFYSAFEKMTSV